MDHFEDRVAHGAVSEEEEEEDVFAHGAVSEDEEEDVFIDSVQFQTDGVIHPKVSIEANPDDDADDIGEFVTLRRGRRLNQPLSMIGTKTVVGALTGKKVTVPVLSDENEYIDRFEDGVQLHTHGDSDSSDMSLTQSDGKILEVNDTHQGHRTENGDARLHESMKELQHMNHNQAEEIARLLSEMGKLKGDKESTAKQLENVLKEKSYSTQAGDTFNARQTSAWAEVDTELFQPGKGHTFDPNSYSTPARKHVQYADQRLHNRASRGGHRASHGSRAYREDEMFRNDVDTRRQRQPRYENPQPCRENVTNIDSRRRRSASLYSQEIDDSAGALKLLDDSVRRKSWGKDPKPVPAPVFDGGDFLTYLLKFENVADANGWGGEDRKRQLLAAQKGPSATVVISFDVETQTYDELVNMLARAFNGGTPEARELAFSKRIQKFGETATMYAHNVFALFTWARPGTKTAQDISDLIRTVLVGLQDKEMARHIYLRKPKSFKELLEFLGQEENCKDILGNAKESSVETNLNANRSRTNWAQARKNQISEIDGSVELLENNMPEEVWAFQKKQMPIDEKAATCWFCREVGHFSRRCSVMTKMKEEYRNKKAAARVTHQAASLQENQEGLC